jgi:predicted transcriptional regulator
MDNPTPNLGDQQLEILRFVAEHAPVAPRDVADHFDQTRGLARTTVITVMENLRKKGLLTRRKMGGTYHYSPAVKTPEVEQGLVHRFVENTLGGSISPFVAYLLKGRSLTDDEVAELRKLADELDRREEDAS